MSLFTNQYAHWHQFFENTSVSPQDFYNTLQQAIAEHKLPDVKANRQEVFERGLLSPKRAYLQIKRDWVTYNICAAPFGRGFFVSSRLLANTWKSWPVLCIPASMATVVPMILFSVTLILLHSLPVALLLSFFSFIFLVGLFILCILLWLMRRRMTYWRLDSMLAFHEAVHGLLVEKINEVIETSGRKPLSAEETKPVLHKLLQR